MRIAIVGAGAIGCLFGSRLSLAGNDVTLIHRSNLVVRAIHRHGVILRESRGKPRAVHVPIKRGPLEISDVDLLIVTVKAYDTKGVATSYRGKIGPAITVLSLQNGLGNVETLRSYLKRPVLAGSTTEGSLYLGPGRIRHTGRGLTVIGSPKADSLEIDPVMKRTFNAAGFRTTVDPNINGVLWTKTLINAAINPLTALTRMSNGALSRRKALIEVGSEVISEGMMVSRAEHVKLVGDPRRLWKKILVSTRGNKSSMLQDIETGKMTEIRQLNGAIVSHAKRVGVRVPINETLTKLVLELEFSVTH